MEKTCRACLSKSPKMFSFHDISPQRRLPVSDMYEVLTDINLSIEEISPASMCPYCVEQLENAFTFRELCIYTDNNLKKDVTEEVIKDTPNADKKSEKEEVVEDTPKEDKKNVRDEVIEEIPKADINCDDSVHIAESHPTKSPVRRIKPKILQKDIEAIELKQSAKLCEQTQNLEEDTSELSSLCSICGKVYPMKKSMKQHIRTHQNIKPFCCSYCGHKFRTSCSFKSHVRRHTGEKPYVCSYCNHRCRSSNALFIHVRRHKQDFPYVCIVEDCSKSFAQNSSLKAHIRRKHTGERNFQCDSCEKDFVTNGDLKQHHKNIHEAKPTEKKYDCPLCDNKYFSNHSVTRHLRRVHAVIRKQMF